MAQGKLKGEVDGSVNFLFTLPKILEIQKWIHWVRYSWSQDFVDLIHGGNGLIIMFIHKFICSYANYRCISLKCIKAVERNHIMLAFVETILMFCLKQSDCPISPVLCGCSTPGEDL